MKITAGPTSALLLSTGLVCAVELAALSAGLASRLHPAQIAIMLGAFHLGYLVADRVGSFEWVTTYRGWLVLTATFCCALALELPSKGSSFAIVAVSLFAFNSVTQAYRRLAKPGASTGSRAKNAAKALGMILGGVLGHFDRMAIFLVVAALVLVVLTPPATPLPHQGGHGATALSSRDRLLLVGEFLHHAHYFAYCYTFWYLAPSLISPWTGLWFLFGWACYFITERVWRERVRKFSAAMVAAGHVVVAAALLTMPHLAPSGVLLAWVITGLGGGTAYMLGNAGQLGPREKYEDAGHVAGTAIAAAVAAVAGTSRWGAELTTITGACLAMATAMMFVAASNRRATRPFAQEPRRRHARS